MYTCILIIYFFSIFYEKEAFFCHPGELEGLEKGGVAIARGKSVDTLDVYNSRVFLTTGEEIQYDKCLIATG